MSWEPEERSRGRGYRPSQRGNQGLQRLGSSTSGLFTGIIEQIEDKAPYRGICRYLKVSVWQSEIMFTLPAKGQSRFIYLYILTGPHTLAYHVPGLYNIGQQAIREGLRLTPQEFCKAMGQLREVIGMKTDFLRSMVWLPSALAHLGPPANPNIVRGYIRALQSMPESPLKADAISAYAPFLATLGPSFLKPFADGFPEVCQTMPKPIPIDKREETKEREREPMNEGGGLLSEGARPSPRQVSSVPSQPVPQLIRPQPDYAENAKRAREILDSIK